MMTPMMTSIMAAMSLFKGKYLYKAMMPNSPWGEHEMDYVLILRNFDLSRIEVNAEEVENYAVVTTPFMRMTVLESSCGNVLSSANPDPKRPVLRNATAVLLGCRLELVEYCNWPT
ncbi:unnamed protein product, partial [Mesorhabditis belari]|uniref:Uncharacterized protein n=1 Tax=Mesorhabditis belari TaxID=2138241 RepID=A0AAF3EY08_9BILA